MRAHTFTTTTPTITQMFPLDLRQEFFRRVMRPSKSRRLQKPTNRERMEAREFDILGLVDRNPYGDPGPDIPAFISEPLKKQILGVCSICGHPHLDYVDDGLCELCGCDGTDTPGEPMDE